MYSIAFPNMLSHAKTNLFLDHEATMSNLKLVLLSTKNDLLGDPDFGSLLKRKIFEQNTSILVDLLIDDIYTTIMTFMPQISLKRNDITVDSDGMDVFVKINCINLIDHKNDLYVINLTEESANE